MQNIRRKIRFFLLFFALFFLLSPYAFSQSCYNYSIDTLLLRIDTQSIYKIVHELTGDIPTIVNGHEVTIVTRAYNYPMNDTAAAYIYEKFASYGLNPSYFQFSSTGRNVIGEKIGIKYPNKKYIICGHYDSYPWQPRSIGADDDATGTCAVLEAARLLTALSFDYTMVFIAWDEEERGLYGSKAYVDTCFAHGDSIIAALNVDMVAYDANFDHKADVITNISSMNYANIVSSGIMAYAPYIIANSVISAGGGSDNYSFWQRGYKAVWPFENDVNYHVNSMQDTITWFNPDYYLNMVRGIVGAFAVLGKNYIINIDHHPSKPVSYDTSSRLIRAIITSNYPIAGGINAPRMYYRVGNGPFSYLNAYYNNLDTFNFMIPGQSFGNTIYYYFAAQDSSGSLLATNPGGGRGFSPPGTTAPSQFFSYSILNEFVQCSNTVPRDLPPKSYVIDSIIVDRPGILIDVNVNLTIYHSNDQDLSIQLIGPNNAARLLSVYNGGNGANYINTVFDDGAIDSITHGSPPFTGTFIPIRSLSVYQSLPMNGVWKLRIYNNSDSITGQLASWCLNIDFHNPIGIKTNQIPVKNKLSQNYPNPFNSRTKINFSLVRDAQIKLVIYDILGREVKVLINDKFNEGEYNFLFNAESLSSGLYFYSMFLDGKLFDSKKMVLIK